MRRIVAGSAAVCAFPLLVWAYQLTGTSWRHQPYPMGEDWQVCTQGMPSGGRARSRDGAFVWNYEHFQFSFGDDSCTGNAGGTRDGVNEIAVADLGPDVLAANYTWSFAGGRTYECDMLFSTRFSWHTGTSNPPPSQHDWWSVAAHEMGHCLGLAHEEQGSPRPVMYKSLASGEVRRQPTADDLQGRHVIYGFPGGDDYDRDGIADAADNCKCVPNAAQHDGDNDGVGNHCDSLPSFAFGMCINDGDPSRPFTRQADVTCGAIPPGQTCF